MRDRATHVPHGTHAAICVLHACRSLNPPPADGTDTRTTPAERIPFWVIGTEGGFFSRPVQKTELLMGGADRFDIIFSFTSE